MYPKMEEPISQQVLDNSGNPLVSFAQRSNIYNCERSEEIPGGAEAEIVFPLNAGPRS